jgi:chemotaxis protein CheD
VSTVRMQDVGAPVTYFDPRFKVQAAKILPGEYYVTGRDMALVTVLGSCVSACIRDPESGIGGMNHFMLPGGAERSPASASARYGAYAMEVLINQLLKMGAKRGKLEAKIFGGCNALLGASANSIGESNARFVQEFLSTEGIVIAAQDLLDVYARKVYYFPRTGRVLVKKLRTLRNDTIQQREREYNERLTNSRIDGEVELFR